MTSRTIAAAIRNTGYGFQLIDDVGHTPSGLSSVTTYDDRIVVTFNFTAKTVGTVSITGDERFSTLGFTAGASVGFVNMTIWIGQPAGFTDYVYYSNGWKTLNGHIDNVTMDSSTGLITCTHPSIAPVGGSVVSRSLTKRASQDSMSETKTCFYLVDNNGAVVKTPTTDNRVWIQRAGARRVNPLTEMTQPGSNLWIHGIFGV